MAEAPTIEIPGSSDRGGTFRAVLSNSHFLYLWIAQLFSQIAQQTISFALVIQVSGLAPQLSTATAIVIICFTVPAILCSAVAGVFVDRRSKKWVLVTTNVARSGALLLYVLTVTVPGLDTALTLAVLYLTTLGFSAVSQFFAPAEAAMIPLLVPRERLIAANSLFNLTLTASQLLGFVFLGPLLVPLIGFQWLYAGLLGCYVLCAFLTWRLPDREAARFGAGADVTAPDDDRAADKIRLAYREFRAGWQFIRGDAGLMTAILYWSVANAVLMMLAVVGPKFLKIVLNVDSQHLYFLMVPGGIGLVFGVVLVGRFASERNRSAMIHYGLLAVGGALLVLAALEDALRLGAQLLGQPPPAVALVQILMGALAFCLGLVNSFITVPAQTVLQERAPEYIRARVFSAFYTVFNIILIVPLLLTAGLADLLDVRVTMALIATIVLAIALGGMRYQRRHRGLLRGPPRPAVSPRNPEAVLPGTRAR